MTDQRGSIPPNVKFTVTKGSTQTKSSQPRNSNTTDKPSQPRNSSVAAPSPVNFPRVDAATQKSRDTNRRQILTEELNSEQSSLNAARKALQDAESNKSAEEKTNPKLYLERIGRLRETIVMHEKNTAALQAEISRMR